MEYKKNNAPSSTVTRDMNSLSQNVGNAYETVAIISKRANQIDQELKVELDKKLQDFASYADGIEEVFENRFQGKSDGMLPIDQPINEQKIHIQPSIGAPIANKRRYRHSCR